MGSESQIQVRFSGQNDIKKYLHYAEMGLPGAILLFILIHLCFEEAHPAFTRFTYFLIMALHGISLYIKLDSFTLNNDPMIKKIIIHPETHIIIFAFALFFPSISSLFTWTVFVIIEALRLVVVIKQEVAPRAGGAKESIAKLCDSILSFQYLLVFRAGLEIFLNVYLFFYALFAWNGSVFIAFLIYFIGYTAYAILADPNHKQVYHFIDSKLAGLNNPQVDQARGILGQVPEYCRIIYPIPENLIDQLKAHFD